MGNCIYCHNKAGFFRTKHKECHEAFKSGEANILKLITDTIVQGLNVKEIEKQIVEISNKSFIPTQRLDQYKIQGWENALNKALEDDFLSLEEEDSLANSMKAWNYGQDILDTRGAYTKFAQAQILRKVMEGEIPENVVIKGRLPFNLLKNEKLVWLFHGVEYYETRLKKQYVGGSQGVSIRVAKGIYYRTSAFKGEPVINPETIHIDTGSLGITDKHIYFTGQQKSFRVKYPKIVSFTPYSDGMGIQKDATTAKPQSFKIGDGWFAYNLATNLSQLA